MIERVTLPDGRVVDRELKADSHREVAVGRVESLTPPMVSVPGVGVVRVSAVAVGVAVAIDDWVFAARVGTPKGERVVVIAKLNVLGDD